MTGAYERSKKELSHFTDEESDHFLGESKVACSRWHSKQTNWTLSPDLCPAPPTLFLHCPDPLCLPGGLLYIHQGPGRVSPPFRCPPCLCDAHHIQLRGEVLERGTVAVVVASLVVNPHPSGLASFSLFFPKGVSFPDVDPLWATALSPFSSHVCRPTLLLKSELLGCNPGLSCSRLDLQPLEQHLTFSPDAG